MVIILNLLTVSAGIGALLFAGSFCVAACSDARCGEIPDGCSVGLLAAGICRLLAGRVGVIDALAGLFLLGGITLALSLWRDGMGGGDVKLIAAASFAVGLRAGVFSLAASLILALLCAVARRILTRQRSGIKLAPFLMTGYFLIYFL